jgi:GH43 family beta-xylosidase
MHPDQPVPLSRRAFLAASSAALVSPLVPQDPGETTFTNPIARRGADPWVLRHADSYLYCFSRSGSVHLSRSPRLEEIALAPPVAVWTPPPGQPYSRNLWAPELHRLNDRWYIYVAADDGANANHRMYCLERAEADPLGPFTLKGKVSDSSDKWAIDGTVFRHADGHLYFVWSGWEGDTDVRQDLYIARLSDPWTISSPRALISRPTHPWETHGRPLVNEGPTALQHAGATHIVYSASGSWTDQYCLGLLTLTGADPLSPSSWLKRDTPVFSGTSSVTSPGHASFTTSPDGLEPWIVYHAARRPGSGWDRVIHTQPFTFSPDSSPSFGPPIPAGVPLPLPSGSSSIPSLRLRENP